MLVSFCFVIVVVGFMKLPVIKDLIYFFDCWMFGSFGRYYGGRRSGDDVREKNKILTLKKKYVGRRSGGHSFRRKIVR